MKRQSGEAAVVILAFGFGTFSQVGCAGSAEGMNIGAPSNDSSVTVEVVVEGLHSPAVAVLVRS